MNENIVNMEYSQPQFYNNVEYSDARLNKLIFEGVLKNPKETIEENIENEDGTVTSIEKGWLENYSNDKKFVPNTLTSGVLLEENHDIKLNDFVTVTETNDGTEANNKIKKIHVGFFEEPENPVSQSFSENQGNAIGKYSHAEGSGKASGDYSHAEGLGSIASGQYSHAEGFGEKMEGESEVIYTQAKGWGSHAEGRSTIAEEDAAHAEGFKTIASGVYSHAEGQSTNAKGTASHAEGWNTNTKGIASHAEGNYTTAFGNNSHIEGLSSNLAKEVLKEKLKENNQTEILSKWYEPDCKFSLAYGNGSHVEGEDNIAFGDYSHAEGTWTLSEGAGSHAEGGDTIAAGIFSHAEGSDTEATNYNSHSEGYKTKASGEQSHAEGEWTEASGKNSHAEGDNTTAEGEASHAEGYNTLAKGNYSHAEGIQTKARGRASHTEGEGFHYIIRLTGNKDNDKKFIVTVDDISSLGVGDYLEIQGIENTIYRTITGINEKEKYIILDNSLKEAFGDYTVPDNLSAIGISGEASGNQSHVEGYKCLSIGLSSHAEGCQSKALNDYSHAEGYLTTAKGRGAHAEGVSLRVEGNTLQYLQTIALGEGAHAEGMGTQATGQGGHSEGYTTVSQGEGSHSEGYLTASIGSASHAEGMANSVYASSSHAEGSFNTIGDQDMPSDEIIYSHAEGVFNTIKGSNSHVEGYFNIGQAFQHVQGRYNQERIPSTSEEFDLQNIAFIIGNGINASNRSNAFTVAYNGTVQTCSGGKYETSGADYAEYFEWQDQNINNEDRRGYFVSLEEEKIKIANPNDYILGIVSATPAIIGNSYADWQGRYLTDEFGSLIIETNQIDSSAEKDIVEKINKLNFKDKILNVFKNIFPKIEKSYKQNDKYDSSLQYIQRADRPEWDAVGMLGVLSVRDDGTCQVNGYCTVADGGIATASETGYRVIKRVNDHIVKIIFK